MAEIKQTRFELPSDLEYKAHFGNQQNCWSLRCSWSNACRRCSNYIFIPDLTPGFNAFQCNTRGEKKTFVIKCALY